MALTHARLLNTDRIMLIFQFHKQFNQRPDYQFISWKGLYIPVLIFAYLFWFWLTHLDYISSAYLHALTCQRPTPPHRQPTVIFLISVPRSYVYAWRQVLMDSLTLAVHRKSHQDQHYRLHNYWDLCKVHDPNHLFAWIGLCAPASSPSASLCLNNAILMVDLSSHWLHMGCTGDHMCFVSRFRMHMCWNQQDQLSGCWQTTMNSIAVLILVSELANFHGKDRTPAGRTI